MQIINSIIIILIANAFLYLTYRLIEFKWPDYYFSYNDKTGILFSQTFLKYSIFRLFPLIAIIITILGVTQKSGINTIDPSKVGFFIGLVFGLFNDGKAIFHIITKTNGIKIYRNHIYQIVIHVLTIIILSIVGYLFGKISKNNFYYYLLPDFQKVIENFWTSFFTAMLIFVGLKLRKHLTYEVKLEEIIGKKSRSINKEHLSLIEKECLTHSADEILVKAVAIAENIERPLWFRRFEYLLSKFGYRGSFGIMQMKSNEPLNDENSIKQAIEKYFSGSRYTSGGNDRYIRNYNNDDNFVMFVNEIIKYISPNK